MGRLQCSAETDIGRLGGISPLVMAQGMLTIPCKRDHPVHVILCTVQLLPLSLAYLVQPDLSSVSECIKGEQPPSGATMLERVLVKSEAPPRKVNPGA